MFENKIKRKIRILNVFDKINIQIPKRNFKFQINKKAKIVKKEVDIFNKDNKENDEELKKKEKYQNKFNEKIENKDIEEFNKVIKEKFKDKNFSLKTATNSMILDLMMHNKFLRNYLTNSTIETGLSTENSESYYFNRTIDSSKKSNNYFFSNTYSKRNKNIIPTFLTSISLNKYNEQKIRAHQIYEEVMKNRRLNALKKKIALKKLEGEYQNLIPKIEKKHYKKESYNINEQFEKFKRKPHNYIKRPISYVPKQKYLSLEFRDIFNIEKPAMMTSIILNQGIKDENLFTEGRKDKARRHEIHAMREIENLLDYKKNELDYEDSILAREYYNKSNEILSRLNEKVVKDNYAHFKKKYNISNNN